MRSSFVLSIIFLAGLLGLQNAHAQNVRITNMDALDAGVWVNGTINLNDDICVYKVSGNNRYRLTPTDDSTNFPGQFMLENPTGTVGIPYQFRWRNRIGDGGQNQTYGVTSNRRRANRTDELCAVDGLSANLNIRIRRADLEAAPAGVYSAEVQALIEPP